MRILIHGINYSPELTGIGKYSGEMAEWLAAKGHEVRVVTAPPYYPQWRVAEGYANRWSQTLLETKRHKWSGSVVVFRCPLWVPIKLSGLKRILHLASFAFSSFPVMLRQIFWSPDIVWVVEPALFCAPVALLTGKLCGAKTWLHVQDFEVDAAFEMGLLRARWAKCFALWCERFLMKRFDMVSSISAKMVLRLQEKGIQSCNSFLFRNWVDTKSISFIQSSSFRQELNIQSGEFVALYSGNMGEKQGLENVIEAARILVTDQKIRFVLCGDGAAKSRLQEMAKRLPNIMWLPLQPIEKLNELLNLANVHLLPQCAGVADLVMPSKLTGMLASGRPVVASAEKDTELANVLAERGLVVSPGNIQDFASTIRMLSVDEDLCASLGRSGRIYAEENLDSNAVLSGFEIALVESKKKNNQI